ncbi:hypothetical protein NDU88_006591, partial [Pleurodeles waltl]
CILERQTKFPTLPGEDVLIMTHRCDRGSTTQKSLPRYRGALEKQFPAAHSLYKRLEA